jgi:glycosyltransferase involved in cell wall biosynthesis
VYRVSVVIPTLNRAAMLATTIERIENQTVGRDAYEVLIVDNNSTDTTQAVLAQKAAAYPNLKGFIQTKRGAAATRNVGIRAASGEIVLFIDDDILAEPDLVERHIQYHAENPGASIIGTVTSAWHDSSDPFLRYLRDKGIFNPYSIACGKPMDFSYYHTGNVSSSRKQLCEVGGFDEQFFVYGMEDIELGYRLEQKGSRMIPGVAARGRHEYYPTCEQFIERCQQAGYSLGKMIELHPELKKRFTENGKRTSVLKRFHVFYRMLMTASNPFYKGLMGWEERRGTGKVGAALDQHYYWAIRYHFFLGYREFVRSAQNGQTTGNPVLQPGRQRIPNLAIERHE